MATHQSTHQNQRMARHLEQLRDYAKRIIVDGERLDPDEEYDRMYRMREFLSIGASFKCTGGELASLLYNGLFEIKRGCGCFSCKMRKAHEQPADPAHDVNDVSPGQEADSSVGRPN